MTTVALLLCALAVAAGLDRALLHAEARGWIYYRRRKASPGTAAGAALALQALTAPRAAHAIEMVVESPWRDAHDEGEGRRPRGARR